MIKLAKNLDLPLNAVTQKLAFLGISGSGKTYGASKFVEELLAANGQVVVIDTIGNWWGLRLGPGGRGEGFAIPILGGEKGDVPLESTAGALVADTIVESRSPMIVDVSDLTVGELRRFVVDFATRLLKRKKQHKSPVMVVWEECQDIVPQRVMGESAQMVGAVERLIKKGRNYGVGTVLISQRPQAVNKDVLNQVETLFCFRTGGAQERKAVSDWIVSKAIDVAELVDELPSLPTGTCFCWSPQWLGVLKKVEIAKKRTFDASATPEFGDKQFAGTLAPVELERFKATMAEAVANAKGNDPKELKKRIAELEKQLKGTNGKAPEVRVERVVEHIEVPVDLAKVRQALANALVALDDAEAKHSAKLELRAKHFQLVKRQGLPRPTATPSPPTSNGTGGFSKCATEILRALASRHPSGLTRVQAATLAGYSHKSGGFANALSELNSAGCLRKNGALIELSLIGVEKAPAVDRPTSGPDLLNLWSRKLAGKESLMLQALVDAGGLSRGELAERVGLSPSSGGYANYLSRLNSNGLIRKADGMIYAEDVFCG